jgi:hypothetical protein
MVNRCLIILLLFLTALLLGAFMAACNKSSPSPELMDKSPFTGDPCAAPCWHGLEIAKSDEAEVVSTLKVLRFIDQETLKIKSTSGPGFDPKITVPGKWITADCLRPKKHCLDVDIADGRLHDIKSILNYKITFNEVLENIGNPDKVVRTNYSAEVIACYIRLVWTQKQLILVSKRFPGREGCDYSQTAASSGLVDASLVIAEVDFLPNEEINQMIIESEMIGNYQGINSEK